MKREQLHGFTAAVVVVGHGTAAAQAHTAPPLDASADLARRVALCPAEPIAPRGIFLARMAGPHTSIRRKLEADRSQRDIVRTFWLNDKLNQIYVAIRSVRERRRGLELAMKRREADLSNHQFTMLSVLRQRTQQLTAEAQPVHRPGGRIHRRQRRHGRDRSEAFQGDSFGVPRQRDHHRAAYVQ
ncbi:hypothetical protein [Sorangium cellulosum]|nr:hypothetical protein [Sorangium cellulosum]